MPPAPVAIEVRHVVAARTAVPPVIDGALDDRAWSLAAPANAFRMKLPSEGVAATEDTAVRVLYDEHAIYVGFDCQQRLAPLVARLTRRDRAVEADWVSIGLDTRRDGRTAFEFTVNAGGVLSDQLRYNDTDAAPDWDENWESRVARTGGGWSAEIRIPLRVLRFGALPVQSWGLQLRRYVSARQELDEWQPIPRSAGGEVSRYGLLSGLRSLSSSQPVELWTTGVSRLRARTAAPGQLASGVDLSASAEVDARWHATEDLTLEGTVNPDFAQVDADELVLNLTTFETWYPEKRSFFLEGSETFATPFDLVYTRRIGRIVPAPVLRDPTSAGREQLVDVPGAATIYGATKLVGTVADGWRVGVLGALVGGNEVDVLLPGGARVSRLVDPLSAYEVARARRILNDRADVGAMITATTRAEATQRYPQLEARGTPAQQLCPDGSTRASGARCFHDAYVGAVDGHWRSASGDYALTGQIVTSMLGGGAPITFHDGTVVKGGDVDMGAAASAAKQGGENWIGNFDYIYQGKKLDFDDLGFMVRQNQHYADLGIEYRTLGAWWKTLETHTRLDAFERYNTAGLNLARSYQLGTSARFSNFWSAWLAAYFRPAHFDDREVGDGTTLERAGLLGIETSESTDPRATFSLRTWLQAQALWDGWQVAADFGLLWHALPPLDVELEPNLLFTEGEPRFATRGALAGRYLFGTLAARNLGATLRATYTFTPRLTLQTYAQLFVAAGHYTRLAEVSAGSASAIVHLDDLHPGAGTPATNPDFEQAALNVNLVLRWEFALGSTLFAVYTRTQVPTVPLAPGEPATLDFGALKRAPTVDSFVLKLSYWWG